MTAEHAAEHEAHATIEAEVRRWSPRLVGLSHSIADEPETRFEEHKSAAKISELMEEGGFTVERGIASLPTALRAERGNGELVIGICAEYDALPDIGHGCGHNVIAAAGAGAALGLASVADRLGITVVLLGTPAEEGGAGKIIMIDQGAFDDLSAALMVHPGTADQIRQTSLAAMHLTVTFRGKESHAAAAPHLGRNAADAATIAQCAIGLLRQHLPAGAMVHGIVTNGGTRSNIVPALVEMEYHVRARTVQQLYEIWPRIEDCFRAGALATGTECEIDQPSAPYADLRQDEWLSEAYARAMHRLGRQPQTPGPDALGGSTDMGNVSHLLPSIHPRVSLKTEAPQHTREFAAAAVTEAADTAITDAAIALAIAAADAAADPERRALLLEAHRSRTER